MRLTVQIIAIMVLLGCAKSTEKKNNDSVNEPHHFVSLKNEMTTDSFRINIADIKNRYRGYSTNTILNHEKTDQLFKPDTTGFFGEYTLIDSASFERNGSLIVFNSGTPQNWRYDNTDDIFIMLDYKKDDMTFFNGIRLGSDENELLVKLKNFFHYKKGTIIHAEIENYSTDIYLTDSKVCRITIELNGNIQNFKK